MLLASRPEDRFPARGDPPLAGGERDRPGQGRVVRRRRVRPEDVAARVRPAPADNFAGHVKTVVVFRVDRIARRLREGLDLLCDWCERGVRVVSVTQQVDVSGTMGRMVAALMLGLAEIEWEYRRDRQAAGIAVARDYDGGRSPGGSGPSSWTPRVCSRSCRYRPRPRGQSHIINEESLYFGL